MQRILFLFLVLACGAFAAGDTAVAAPEGTADPVATDSSTRPESGASPQVAAPGLDTVSVAAPALSPEQLAALKEEMARDKARRDSVRAAREEAASSMEWHSVSDSGTSATIQAGPEPGALPAVAPEPAATTRSAKPRLPIPEVPQEREPNVLLWTGVGLAATGLIAWLIFTGNGTAPKEEVDLDPVTDPTAGNSDAKTEKTMTIRWSH